VANELNLFRAAFPGLPPQRTDRLHCTPFTDWASVPLVSLAHGIRLDMSPYYAQAKSWINNRPGYMTGSGNPMRYANLDGSAIDVYQVSGDLVDTPESGITYPAGINAMLDKALGPEGYYGVLGTHYDYSDNFHKDMIASVVAHPGAAMVSADQMLTWLDGRNGST
jgi:hypothetical protein